ncbi:MAG: hypothetical protein IH861_13220 [Chloroflexi bacterium]|nr:hypothetical protein [Chloroflexota bacterium]
MTEEVKDRVVEPGTNAVSPLELRAELKELALGIATSSVTDVADGDDRSLLRKLNINNPILRTTLIATDVETMLSKSRVPDRLAAPDIKWLVGHHHLLTVQVRKLLSGFLGIVVSKALRSNLPVSKIVVDAEEDPEEKTGQVVLRVYVQASPVQALAFWDSLDIEMNNWLDRLDSADRSSVFDDVGLRFYWL